jgi:L-threonylcarbamoyladenylate synthase
VFSVFVCSWWNSLMLRLFVEAHAPDPETIATAAAHIRAGGVVAYPTDTLYGLGADPRSSDAVRRVFAIKGRPDGRPIPLIASDTASAEHVVGFTPLARRLVDAFWPGPLTLLLPEAAHRLAPEVLQGHALIGIRVPEHAVARALAAAAGGVLTATSANRSGSEATGDPAKIAQLAVYGLEVLLDAGRSPGGLPSTIVDASGAAPVLVRAGAVPWGRVLEST